jgi:hypothetical protein
MKILAYLVIEPFGLINGGDKWTSTHDIKERRSTQSLQSLHLKTRASELHAMHMNLPVLCT